LKNCVIDFLKGEWSRNFVLKNRDMLDKLKEITDGNEESIKLYIQSYIKVMTAQIDSLQYALSQEDFEKVLSTLQKAKPLLTTMGYDDILRMVNHVEMGIKKNYARSMTKENTLSLIDDIQDSIDKLEAL